MTQNKLWVFTLLLFLVPQIIEENGASYRGLASSWNMIPSRSLAGLHYIFKGYTVTEDQTLVKVSGPVIEITNGETLGAKVFREGYLTEVDLEDFEEEQLLGTAVFEARAASGVNVGTAFLVGENVVLTNRHVITQKPHDKSWACGKFGIKLNHKEERVSCKRVLHCSKKFDFCVVEMDLLDNGLSLGSEIKPLRLTRKVKIDKDLNLLHIGNAAGMGIQASRGRGIQIRDGEFYHYVPTLGGSSGAPIFNDQGYVVGINWGYTGGNYLDDSSFNRGVLTDTIFSELRKTRPWILKEIKSFRTWHRRMESHRNVMIGVAK